MTRTSLNALVESWKARALKAEKRVEHLEKISHSRVTELEAMVHELSERLRLAKIGAEKRDERERVMEEEISRMRLRLNENEVLHR